MEQITNQAITIINKQAKKLRHEYKHQINPLEALVLSKRLSKILKKDNNANIDGQYLITSLYFDTINDDAYKDKINGINKREKFRIRYYNDNLEYIKLEKKYKINGLCGKRSTILTKDEVSMILHNNIDFLLSSNDELKIEFYTKLKGQLLKAKTIVRYQREAYVYNVANVRITIDKNLSTNFNHNEFLNPYARYIKMDNNYILEIKYDEFLPDIIKDLVMINRQASAYSKYANCRRYD